MKILYHHRIASKDGQYVHVEELTSALKNLGHELIIVSPRVGNDSSFGSKGGYVAFMKRYIPGFIYELMELGYSCIAFIKLCHAITKYQPDCIYERYNLYLPAGIWIKKLYKLPMLLEVNAPLYDERSKYSGIALPWLAKWSEQYAWKNADYVLPVTKVLAECVSNVGVEYDHIMVIPNGINSTRFNRVPNIDEAKHNIGLSGNFILGFTGFVREWHGLDRVVDFLTGHTNDMPRHLLIVGDGPACKAIMQRAVELGVSHLVTITGVVQRDEVSSYVATFDIALQPDVVPYASPLKLFEYMAMGRPIIAPNTNNICEVLTDRKNALLFDTASDEDMLVKLGELCSDNYLRESIASEARSTIFRERYTWENNALKVIEIYKSLGVIS